MKNPFQSFFMGGFECADQLNRQGDRVNLLRETRHDVRAREDYRLLSRLGIRVVREGICWSHVEREPGVYDFSEVLHRMTCARKEGIQQVWDLVHFGYPDGLFPTHPKFLERFEKLCTAFARFYRQHGTGELLVIPINEISFLSWLSGDVRGTVPYAVHSGWDIKYHLCKAAIAGIRVLKKELPDCIVIMAEPLTRIHGDGIASLDEVHRVNEYQYQAADMITGKICPELGGDSSLLDILGINYYWTCQWTINGGTLPWPEEGEKKRVPLHRLLETIYHRYKCPLFLAETGHFGIGRVPWLEKTVQEVLHAFNRGIPLWGICIYPVTDRPDWDDLLRYSNCGIFDLDENFHRVPCQEYRLAILHQQEVIAAARRTHQVSYRHVY